MSKYNVENVQILFLLYFINVTKFHRKYNIEWKRLGENKIGFVTFLAIKFNSVKVTLQLKLSHFFHK